MSNLTYFSFALEQGFAGNLAKAPEFKKTKNGQAYARVTLFCTTDSQEKQSNPMNSGELSLIAYARFYNENLFSEIESLNKGDFIRIQFSKLSFAKTIDKVSKLEESVVFVDARNFCFLSKAKINSIKPINYNRSTETKDMQSRKIA